MHSYIKHKRNSDFIPCNHSHLQRSHNGRCQHHTSHMLHRFLSFNKSCFFTHHWGITNTHSFHQKTTKPGPQIHDQTKYSSLTRLAQKKHIHIVHLLTKPPDSSNCFRHPQFVATHYSDPTFELDLSWYSIYHMNQQHTSFEKPFSAPKNGRYKMEPFVGVFGCQHIVNLWFLYMLVIDYCRCIVIVFRRNSWDTQTSNHNY